MKRAPLVLSALAALTLAGCSAADKAGGAVKSVGNAVADGAGDLTKGAVSLVNVNLSNVLNDLALDLKIDKANIPINAQIPITIAANICGVSINILSVSTGGSPNCTAKGTSPELSQAVQQQIAANGSVGGGNQTGAPTAPSSGTTTGATTSPTPSPTTGATITAPATTATPGATATGTSATEPGSTTPPPKPQ